MSIGSRLKFAREKSGLTIAQVCARSGIGESSISDFENDKREPRMSQLGLLAGTYKRQISYFLAEGASTAESPVLWREAPTETTGLEIEAEFRNLCQQYRNLEMWCDEVCELAIPQYESKSSKFTYTDARELARKIRNQLSLGDYPGPGLLRVLEEVCGVKIFFRSFDPSGTAASIVSEDFGAGILLNSKNVPWRRTYDLAHELFHIVTWTYFRGGSSAGAHCAPSNEESLANCFASHLLMPDDVTRSAIEHIMKDGKLTFDDLSDVARRFEVSVEALLWRMSWLFNRTEEQTRRDIGRARTCAPAPIPESCSEPPEFPDRYVALARRALKKGAVSVGRYAAYLNISRPEAMQHLSTEAVNDDEIEITSA